MSIRGWKQCDFIYVSGDAYVDHPSFGTAIISRILEAHGYKVGIIAQPDWKDKKSIEILGRPRLGFLVSAGNMDSMVNHYSVSKKRRKEDSYTPGGVMGKRPDYAVVVYCNLIRSVYKDVPIIIGGIEASLRRLAHYDYWSGKLKRSVLLDSQADIISYGMGERSICLLYTSQDRLPQGSPASAAISNLVMKPFDTYMEGWCRDRGIVYTRYCDDMTFSGDFRVSAVYGKVNGFLGAMGFELNQSKTKVLTRHVRQTVTGMVVNDKVQVPLPYRRALRQEVYYCLKYGVKEHLRHRCV